jgi:hypothetical protein
MAKTSAQKKYWILVPTEEKDNNSLSVKWEQKIFSGPDAYDKALKFVNKLKKKKFPSGKNYNFSESSIEQLLTKAEQKARDEKELQNQVIYIDFLNKDKNHQQDRIEFTGPDAEKKANEWGRKNLENFRPDMIKMKKRFAEGGNTDDGVDLFNQPENYTQRLKRVFGQKKNRDILEHRNNNPELIAKMLKQTQIYGYTFDIDSGGWPVNLRRMNMAKGGDVELDAQIKAKRPGYRIPGTNKPPTKQEIKEGKAYYETRFNRSDENRRTYPYLEKGGDVDDEIDLFDEHEKQPKEIKRLFAEKKYRPIFKDKPNDYDLIEELLEKTEKLGYTFDYGLDGGPYGLHKIKEKKAGGQAGDESSSVAEIAYRTGLRAQAVRKFQEDFSIPESGMQKIADGLRTKKLLYMDVTTAVAGKPGNRYQKQVVEYAGGSASKMAHGGKMIGMVQSNKHKND